MARAHEGEGIGARKGAGARQGARVRERVQECGRGHGLWHVARQATHLGGQDMSIDPIGSSTPPTLTVTAPEGVYGGGIGGIGGAEQHPASRARARLGSKAAWWPVDGGGWPAELGRENEALGFGAEIKCGAAIFWGE